MKFEVVHSRWAADNDVFEGGVHELELEAAKAHLFAGAAAAGSINIVEASTTERKLLKGHVESQKVSERAYAAAQRLGTWHVGNLEQFIAEREQQLAQLGREWRRSADGKRARHELNVARAQLEELKTV